MQAPKREELPPGSGHLLALQAHDRAPLLDLGCRRVGGDELAEVGLILLELPLQLEELRLERRALPAVQWTRHALPLPQLPSPSQPGIGVNGCVADISLNLLGMDRALSLEALLAARAAAGRPYAEVLRVEAFSVGVYELGVGAEDLQRPHSEDELYAVLRGKAAFTMAGETHPVAPGALLYVPAGVPHRFHDIEEDLSLLVVFAPPESP